jgi:uncharacterized damage-inducible protein DinB
MKKMPEPWLRGTLTDVPAIARGVLHALELAQENVADWCSPLSDEEMNARPVALPSVAFHVQHIAGSLDRLLTYAEARQLNEEQIAALSAESQPVASKALMLQHLSDSISAAFPRIRALAHQDLEQPRSIGRLKLPTTLGGLLVHIADHTQRHAGQAVTTAKIMLHGRDTGA